MSVPSNAPRQESRRCRRISLLLATAWLIALFSPLRSTAQDIPPLNDPFGQNPFGGGNQVVPGNEVVFDAKFKLEPDTRRGEVIVTADIADGYHIYSLNQKGGPGPSKFTLTENPQVARLGQFQAETDPHVVENDPAFMMRVEQFEGKAIFKAAVELADVDDPESFSFGLTFDGQACNDQGCQLISGQKIKVTFGGYLEVPAKTGEYRPESAHVTWKGYLEPRVVEPGGTVRLVFEAIPDPTYHVYGWAAYVDEEAKSSASSPTLIALTKRNNWQADFPVASVEPQTHDIAGATAYWHAEPVSWSIDLRVPKGTAEGEYDLAGFLGFQTCQEDNCDIPSTAQFSVKVQVGGETQVETVPLTLVSTDRSYNEVEELAKGIEWGKQATAGGLDDKPVLAILGLAFLAGLILNVMPCVLPVIGLKIMSFVDQAGARRWEVIKLNLWFSAGLIFVFLVLATMAAVFGLGWGQHFQSVTFTVALILIVFTFGLSFLGVWEIPIPGFVGAASNQSMAKKEGAAGAFAKGIFTTILATPCTGPFLVPAISWSLTQPAWLTYLLFATVGLGMASPYLMIGAFPSLINLLPRPGAWMVTFKQLMGFVLMGTVVFLFNSLDDKLIMPTMTLLVGIAVACWWIGRTPSTAPLADQFKAWVISGVWSIAIAAFAFLYLAGGIELEWQPYDRVTLDQHLEEGSTVLIDFTADW